VNEIRPRLIRCFAAVFPELTPAQIVAATPTSVQAWDSVATITLTTVVEEEFGIPVDDVEMAASFETLERYLAQLDGRTYPM